MEHSLSHVVREFEHEREILGGLAKKELEDVRMTASRLKGMLDRKSQEMRHIRVRYYTYLKKLAQHVLSQRSQVERFFIDALDLVRKEVKKEKEAAKKAAQLEHNKRMRHVKSFIYFRSWQNRQLKKRHHPSNLKTQPTFMI